MNSAPVLQFCPHCGTKLSEAARFCAQCGTNLSEYRGTKPRQPIEARMIALVVVAAVGVFATAWYAQEALVGRAPTEKFKEQGATKEAAELDSELKRLKQAAEQNPKDKKGWTDYAQALADRLTAKDAPRELVFETIGVLRQILDIDPNDREALLAMAEVSFQQQAFEKSAEFYRSYLQLSPEDIDVRARYASSLSFVGKFDDALTELNRVLSVKADHFHALAYSAVTYAEMGNRTKAKELGEKALHHAPSEEAKNRFSAFLNSLEKSNPKASASAAAPPTGSLDQTSTLVIEHIKNNPVAGRKFIDATVSGTTLTINLDNFPMAQMPPFVKQKFTGAIREKAFSPGSALTTVILYDKTNAVELDRLTP